MNPFAVFSLPEAFALDEAELERRYFELQRQFHPDRFAKADVLTRQRAANQSMDINRAYQQLKDPLKRAQVLLSLKGIEVNGERDTVKPSATLLMEVMALQEALEQQQDAAARALTAERLAMRVSEAQAELAAQCAQEHWTNAAEAAIRLRYLEKISQEWKLKDAR